jgi:hypothetical protein
VRIVIEAEGLAPELVMEAELADTPTGRAIWEALPLTAQANTWGDEVYFRVPVEMELDETAAEVVEVGDLGYWPTGAAFCIFFGVAPVRDLWRPRRQRRRGHGPLSSLQASPRVPGAVARWCSTHPASAVSLVGRLLGEARRFKKVPPGATIVLKRTAG